MEISLETDKEMRMFFGVNPKNKWEPKISETLLLKEGVNEFSFVTDTQEQDEDMEVLFQFGGFGNTPPCNITMKGLSMEAASADDIAAVAAKRAAVTEPSLVKEYSFSKLDNYQFDNAGHGDNASVYAECRLEFGGMAFEGQQGLFKFIYGLRNVQFQEIQPFFIDKTHFADSLDCRFLGAQLFNPRKCPDMAVGIRTHFFVLRISVKNRF